MRHPDAWYDANLGRCAAILAYLDDPTESNREAMHDACAKRQATLFTAPPHAGVATVGQPEPCGLAGAPIQGARRSYANF